MCGGETGASADLRLLPKCNLTGARWNGEEGGCGRDYLGEHPGLMGGDLICVMGGFWKRMVESWVGWVVVGVWEKAFGNKRGSSVMEIEQGRWR